MRTRKVIILFLWLVPILLLLVSCGMNPEKAREKLAEMGIEYNEEAFLHSVERGDTVVVNLFLISGIDVETEYNGYTPLISAAWEGNGRIIEILLSYNAKINAKSDGGHTALTAAASQGNFDAVEILLKKGAEVNAKRDDGRTALIEATMCGGQDLKLKIMGLLLRHGADVNSRGNGWNVGGGDSVTALMFASYFGDEKVVKLLLANGANINAKDVDGRTALLFASSKGHEKIEELLLKNGAEDLRKKAPEYLSWDKLSIPPNHVVYYKISNFKSEYVSIIKNNLKNRLTES
ncbi:ankyrin repeat domain-containing protein [bacterium]|nr:ankyrin repeat domain-containing protein [bacterium]